MAVGGGVSRFRPGDEVYGDLSACGFGGCADYVRARENALALLLGPPLSPFANMTVHNLLAGPSQDDLAFLSRLFEAGEVTPVIDRRYPLPELPAAMRYLAAGHARGKVVITVAHPGR